MNVFWMIVIIVLAMIYILSPIDGIPDMIPVLGWLDDTFLLGLLVYYLRYKRMPGFLAGLSRLFFKNSKDKSGARSETSSNQENFDKHKTAKGPTASRTPYQILGVKPGASFEEIQAAYRMAAQQYHPDKVVHLGEEFQELAQKKFVEIQEAYSILTQKRS